MTVTDANTVAAPPTRIGVRLRRSEALARSQRRARTPVSSSAPPAMTMRCTQSTKSAIPASGQTRKALPGASPGSQNRNHSSMSGPRARRNGARSKASPRDRSRPPGNETRNQTKSTTHAFASHTPTVTTSDHGAYWNSGPTISAKPLAAIIRPIRGSTLRRSAIRPLPMNDQPTTTTSTALAVRPPRASSSATSASSQTPTPAAIAAIASDHHGERTRPANLELTGAPIVASVASVVIAV